MSKNDPLLVIGTAAAKVDGLKKSTGQEIVRLTLHLTPDQKRKLKIKSLQAGFENASAFVVETLQL